MGIIKGVMGKEGPLPKAYMCLGMISGSAKTGWQAPVNVYRDKASRDKGEQPLQGLGFSVAVPGTNGGTGPGFTGIPAALDDAPTETAPISADNPYELLYAELMRKWKTTPERCD